jgi:hypothetical protein
MLEKEVVISFIMPLEVDRNLMSQEGAIGYSIHPIKRGGENSKPRSTGRRKKSDRIWAASKIISLKVKFIGGLPRWIDKGIREVVKVAEVNERHIDIQLIYPQRCLQISIHSFKLRVRSDGNMP